MCGNHSVNYRGCPVSKELLKRFKDKQTAKSAPLVFTMHKENFTTITSAKSNEKFPISCADTYKSRGVSTDTSENSKHVFKH